MTEKFIVLGREDTDASRCLKDVYPLLGKPLFYPEQDFLNDRQEVDIDNLSSLLEHFGEPPVLIHNPYARIGRQRIYNYLKLIGHPIFVFERGALPDSWFFDPNGFNADSKSYARTLWDSPLSAYNERQVSEYIARTIERDEHLERQGSRLGGEKLRESLGLSDEKVIFVPLQRPNDTVTVHMAEPVGGCEKFLELIDLVAKELLPQGYVVLCKKHPLETRTPPLRHARYVPNDTHFLDLIELCESVALINSGVGIYAMMMGKPCFIFGQAFYAFHGINQRVTSKKPSEIASLITSPPSVDMTTVHRFIHYLTKEFYSFGKAKTTQRTEADGSISTITTGIDFYEIRIPGRRSMILNAA